MRAREYRTMERAIEEALPRGLRLAVKHRDMTDKEYELMEFLRDDDTVVREVMAEICEYFRFDEDQETGEDL